MKKDEIGKILSRKSALPTFTEAPGQKWVTHFFIPLFHKNMQKNLKKRKIKEKSKKNPRKMHEKEKNLTKKRKIKEKNTDFTHFRELQLPKMGKIIQQINIFEPIMLSNLY